MAQLVMSYVPWWIYAFATVLIYFAIRQYLGEKPALIYACIAIFFVATDYGGDARETWVRKQWAESVERAKAAVAADDTAAAELMRKIDDDLTRQLAEQSRERNKFYEEMRNIAGDDCPISDDDRRRLQPR